MGFSLRMQGLVNIRKFINIVRCVWLSYIGLFVTPRTIACKAPLSMELPRQEYWSGLPFPPAGDLPDSRTKPVSPASPALAGGFFTIVPPGKPPIFQQKLFKK